MPRTAATSDTCPEAAARVVDGWRSMTIAERAELVDQLSRDVIELSMAGVRLHRPDIDDDALLHEVARRRFGSALADAAYRRSAE